jgi:hypothetical protein
MSNAAVPPGRLQAPADRPAGRRGPRGPVAAVAALAALVPLAFSGPADETSWGRPAMLVAAATLVGGAAMLWTARRRATVAAAFALVALGAAGGAAAISTELRTESRRLRAEDRWAGRVFTDARAQGAVLTDNQAEAVPKGLTAQALRARLGRPATTGIQRITDEPDLRCLAYRSSRRAPNRQTLRAFCFRDGRYVELGDW